MHFKIRRISQWHVDIQVTVAATTVDMGLHTEDQRKTLAAELRAAAEELDPPKEGESS